MRGCLQGADYRHDEKGSYREEGSLEGMPGGRIDKGRHQWRKVGSSAGPGEVDTLVGN